MDKGAHFYCCDFQVHTPRDAHWSGEDAVTDDEREYFGRNVIASCRSKNIGAVAITDHHDMALVEYVRAAAKKELAATGMAVPKERQIVVFPGMELTLAVPCQALVIFDAELPSDLFSLVLNALAIVPAPDSAAKCAQVRRLDAITTLELLCEELNRHAYLKGRYIVLPNVSESGASTLLRSGHSSHYKNMPCVGGYLDGQISQLGLGNSGILSGRNAEYGFKPLGLFQTSDNRRHDFRYLGTSVTWPRPNSRVTSRHLDHLSGNRIVISSSNRP